MAATITLFNVFPKYIGNGTINLASDTVKVSLHSSSFVPNVATMVAYADLNNELGTAAGYTSGGSALTSVTYTLAGGVVTYDAADLVWNATGADIVCATAVLRKSGTANTIVDPLIGYISLNGGSNVVAPSGKPLTLVWNSLGIINLVVG